MEMPAHCLDPLFDPFFCAFINMENVIFIHLKETDTVPL